MKIGIVCTISNMFGRKGYYNGQETGLGKALVKLGHSVIIYKSAMKETKEETVQIEKNLSIRYIHLPHIGVHGYLDCHKYIDKELNAILCFSDTQIFLPHVMRYCKRYNIKFVPYIGTAVSQDDHTIHGLMMDMLYSMGTLRYYRTMTVLSKTDVVAENLRKLGVTKVITAHVGIDSSLLNHRFREIDRDELRQEFGFNKSDILIGCVGKLVEVKQPLRLVELMKKIIEWGEKSQNTETQQKASRYRMIIIGEGELKEQMLKLIALYRLENKIRIIDRIPYKEIWKIYTMSDYFINVSRREVFGMAIMEAIFYETATAAAPASGPIVILKDMEGHRICKDDDEFLRFLTEDYPTKMCLQHDSERILKEFTWDACATQFLSIVSANQNKWIVNSDDFGMTESCTAAIGEAFAQGLITDTTMVANGDAFEFSLKMLQAEELSIADRIGIHYNLTSGKPLTSEILKCKRLTKDGYFRRTLMKNRNYFMLLTKKEKEAIYKELSAQTKKLKEAGIRISHADSHHHVHMNFQIAPIFVRVCHEHGIQKVRIHQNVSFKSGIRRILFTSYNNWIKKQGLITTDYFEHAEVYDWCTQKLKHDGRICEVVVHADYNREGKLIDRRMYCNEAIPVGDLLRNQLEKIIRNEETVAYYQLK